MSRAASRWRGPALVVAGLSLYIVFLLTTLPAHWLGEALGHATHGVARLQNTHGSLWRGSGTLLVHGGGRAPLSAPLHWEIFPLWLLTGKLIVDVESRPDPQLRARLRIGYRHWQLRDLEGEMAAAALSTLYPPAALISPTGNLRVSASEIGLDADGVSGEARITWLGAGGRLGGLGEVGDYLLVINGEDGAAVLRVETLRGALQIAARGRWQPLGDGQLQLDGTLAASGDRAASLAPVLALLNARPEGGQHAFRFSVPAPLPRLFGGPP